MAEELKKTIIVKKIKKGGGGHHGGAWKIAYADFVTAMMAFFLLMWLLGSTSKAQKAGISDYFKTPLMVALKNTGGPAVGASDSIMKDTGGKDITKKQGQVKPDDGSKGKDKSVDIKEAKEALEKAEAAKLEELKEKMQKAIEDSPALSKFKKGDPAGITARHRVGDHWLHTGNHLVKYFSGSIWATLLRNRLNGRHFPGRSYLMGNTYRLYATINA